MSEKQREALERIEASLPKLSEKAQGYVLGYADAMADTNTKKAATEQEKDTKEEEEEE